MPSCNRLLAKPWSVREVKTLRAASLWPVRALTPDGIIQIVETTLSSSVANFNLLNHLVANYAYDGTTPIFVKVHIASAVVIYSSSPTQPAFNTGALPKNSLVFIDGLGSGAAIRGAGGIGGNGGGTGTGLGVDGGRGGTAIKNSVPVHIDATNLLVWGGGGGGGGGGAYDSATPVPGPGPGPGPAPAPGPFPGPAPGPGIVQPPGGYPGWPGGGGDGGHDTGIGDDDDDDDGTGDDGTGDGTGDGDGDGDGDGGGDGE